MKFLNRDLYRTAGRSCLILLVFGLAGCATMDELVTETTKVFTPEEKVEEKSAQSSLDDQLNQAVVGDSVVMDGVSWRVESVYYAATGQMCKRLDSDGHQGRVICKGEEGWRPVRSVVIE